MTGHDDVRPDILGLAAGADLAELARRRYRARPGGR
jgi:hypothetical protein